MFYQKAVPPHFVISLCLFSLLLGRVLLFTIAWKWAACCSAHNPRRKPSCVESRRWLTSICSSRKSFTIASVILAKPGRRLIGRPGGILVFIGEGDDDATCFHASGKTAYFRMAFMNLVNLWTASSGSWGCRPSPGLFGREGSEALHYGSQLDILGHKGVAFCEPSRSFLHLPCCGWGGIQVVGELLLEETCTFGGFFRIAKDPSPLNPVRAVWISPAFDVLKNLPEILVFVVDVVYSFAPGVVLMLT